MKRKYAAVLISSILAVSLCVTMLSGCQRREDTNQGIQAQQSTGSDLEALFASGDGNTIMASYGDTFVVDDMQYTIGNACTIVSASSTEPIDKISPRDLAYLERHYVKVPVTIKNVSAAKKLFDIDYLTFFDNTGIEFDYPSRNFDETWIFSDGSTWEDEITYVGNMRQGAQISTYFYLLYNADGHYYIDFFSENDKDKLFATVDLQIGTAQTAEGELVVTTNKDVTIEEALRQQEIQQFAAELEAYETIVKKREEEAAAKAAAEAEKKKAEEEEAKAAEEAESSE